MAAETENLKISLYVDGESFRSFVPAHLETAAAAYLGLDRDECRIEFSGFVFGANGLTGSTPSKCQRAGYKLLPDQKEFDSFNKDLLKNYTDARLIISIAQETVANKPPPDLIAIFGTDQIYISVVEYLLEQGTKAVHFINWGGDTDRTEDNALLDAAKNLEYVVNLFEQKGILSKPIEKEEKPVQEIPGGEGRTGKLVTVFLFIFAVKTIERDKGFPILFPQVDKVIKMKRPDFQIKKTPYKTYAKLAEALQKDEYYELAREGKEWILLGPKKK